jgi:hypothetical protein
MAAYAEQFEARIGAAMAMEGYQKAPATASPADTPAAVEAPQAEQLSLPFDRSAAAAKSPLPHQNHRSRQVPRSPPLRQALQRLDASYAQQSGPRSTRPKH